MSFPHLLMLGLIDGATVGMTVDPPATVGDLDGYDINQFYVVDYSRSTRKISQAEFRFLKGIIRLRRRDVLRARRDRDYYDRLERQMAKALGVAKHARKAA